MKKGFKNLVVDYKTLLNKFTVQDRLSMARSEEGQSILSNLTPEQLSRMFPRYYQERLPDISGFLKAMTPEGRRMVQNGMQIQDGTASGPGGTATSLGRHLNRDRKAPDVTPTWLKKAEEETGVKVSDPTTKAQLTAEQTAVFDLLKKGKIDADDPRLDFINKLSDEDKKAAGVQTIDEGNGKKSFQLAPTEASQMSDEDIAKRIGKPGTAIANEGIGERQAAIIREANKLGISPKDLATVMSYESAGSLDPDRKGPVDRRSSAAGAVAAGAQPQMLGLIQFGATEQIKYGIKPGMGFDAQMEAVGRYLKDRKLDKWLQDNPNATETEKRVALYSTINAGGPDKGNWGKTDGWMGGAPGTVADKALSMFNDRSGHKRKAEELLKDSYTVSSGASTPEEIAAARKRMDEEQHSARRQRVADVSIPALPASVAPEVAEYYGRLNPGQKQKFHEMLGKAGNGDIEAGAGKINEQYKNNPTSIQRVLTSEGLSSTAPNIQNRNGWITAQSDRNWNQCASLSKAFNPNVGPASTWKVRKDLPIEPGTMVASANYGRGPNPQGQAGGVGYHTGIAVTRPDKNGNFLLLDQSSGARATVRQVNVNDPMFRAGGIGVVEGSKKSLDALNVAAQVSPQYAEQAARSAAELRASEEARLATKAQESALKQAGLSSREVEAVQQQSATPTQQTADAQSTQNTKPAEEAPQPVAGQTQAEPPAAAVPPSPTSGEKPGETPNKSDEKPNKSDEKPKEKSEATPETVPALAQGGEVNVPSNSIEAHAIGGTRGDNALVTDDKQKPLFTMNTNKESASYDPVTQSVSVQPLTKNNPNDLAAAPNAQQQEQQRQNDVEQAESPISNSNRILPENTSTAESTSAIYNTVEPVHCPSFSRAMNASNFKRSGSHYDAGAANLR